MSVQAGQKLGKYDLIEKVGQGGMAVVYRGIDNSLNREVAIKILHSHLAENEEARARFGREAQAVAKLRHENILEIHDFSGVDSDQNYIVTEFINGCTLRDFINDHAIHFPEIGAMITVQVCRALGHAHGLGVLHRDVKPENIMIREDGVVKLTDFGISQMVDLQRMTVTGQLLGSPAYMSPEHVRGENLDFRTDVFAVGIVLYQLVTGDLPFQGKNPHEILKRIADCVYPDPMRVNPRIGSELGKIINTALASDPDDRFADILLMQQALDEYLEGSGLESPREELERFFASPVSYQMALEKRLVDYLTSRGKSLVANKGVGALELFNRVLSIDEDNSEVLAMLKRFGEKKRNKKLLYIGIGLVALAGLSLVAKKQFAKTENAGIADLPDASVLATDASPPAPLDAKAVELAAVLIDAGVADAKSAALSARPPVVRRRRADAGDSALAPHTLRSFRLSLSPKGSEFRVDNGPWTASETGTEQLRLPLSTKAIFARNSSCCQERRIAIEEGSTTARINLPYLPGQITPLCEVPGVRVKINGKSARLGRSATIPIVRFVGTEIVKVEFISDDRVDSKSVLVGATKQVELSCDF